MRALSSLVLATTSSLLLACSLDTEGLRFDGAAGSAGATAGAGGAAGGASGQGGGAAAGSAGAGGAGAGGAGAGGAGAGGAEAGQAGSGAGGTAAGAAGSAGSAGGVAGASGTAGTAGAAGAGGATDTPCTASLEGATRCAGADAKTIETCTSEGWVLAAEPCALGCFQKGVSATCTACAAGSTACEKDVLQTCKADGTSFTSVDCAATSKICDPTLKQCVTCTPGSLACVFGNAVKCDATGALDLASGVPCGSASLCEPGVGCKPAACKVGDFTCSGVQIQSCLLDGTGYASPADCPVAGQRCFDGVGCAECNEPSGKTFCVGDASSTCNDGRVTTLATCPAGTCSAATGQCTSCTLGSTQCSPDGLGISTCTDGSGFPPPTPCGGALVCDQGLGSCVVCHPKDVICEGDTLSTCRADGSGFRDPQVCGPGLCDVAERRCDACKPGDRKCEAGQVLACNAAGDFEKIETCATPALCDVTNAVCNPPACKVGELQCGPKGGLRTCNADRTGFVPSGECTHGCVDSLGCVETVNLFSGPTATCAIVDKDELIPVCWGLSSSYLLGPNLAATESSPKPIKNLKEIAKMAIGPAWACALSTKGVVSCWGANARGQLGLGDKNAREQPTVVNIPGTGTVTDISNAATSMCAVKGGAVYCWGDSGSSGVGVQATPLAVPNVSNAVSVQVSGNHRCYTNTSGETYCWGYNREGQLGNGKPPVPPSNPYVPVADPVVALTGGPALQDMVGLSTGGNHSCALRKGSGTLCWGGNNAGQLGVKQLASSFVAVTSTAGTLASVATSRDFSCGVGTQGELFCWGLGGDYQTGRADQVSSYEVNTLAVPPASAIALGEVHGCALAGGDVYCWGSNPNGELGIPSGKLTHSAEPVKVSIP